MKTKIQNSNFDKNEIIRRRELVFLVLSGFFLAAMVLLNVIGITKFIQLGPLSVAIGVLPYPLTFLCTDLICELYGKRRANQLVWIGFVLNVFVLFIMWLGAVLPSVPLDQQPPWQYLNLSKTVFLPNGSQTGNKVSLFELIFSCTSGAVIASMIAYLAAQLCDVHLFHFWKKLTKGKHFWLRNNGSTLISQLVDSVAVISITFGALFYRGEMPLQTLLVLLGGNYLFKFCAALLDTIPAYILVHYLSRYLQIDPQDEHY